jgi:ABC-type antimicrobial peptide transport system permease subunit
LTRSLLDELEPEKLGFQTIALRDESQRALSQGPARMFSWLFLGFSLFLVSAALLLIVLLVRLQLLERAPEIGLLSAIGYSPRLVSMLLSTEFGAVIILGCLLGIPAAFAYAWGLLTWIEKRWPGPGIAVADVTAASFWRSVPVTSALLGFVASVLSAGLALLWAMRDLRGQSSRTLLLGRFQTEIAIATSSHLSKLTLGFLAIMSLAGLVCLGLALISPPQDGPIWFFLSGGVWLIVGLAILSITIQRVRPDVSKRSWWLWLSIRFIARQPRRNTLTITLLALSTFTVTAVEVFYKSPQRDPFVKASGTGGFPLLAESDIPLPIIPSNHLDDWRPLLPDESSERLERLVKEFQHWRVRLYGLAVRPGDDVSCLNLYQPRQPRLLGVPTVLIQRDGFMFRELLENRHAKHKNPWTALTQPDTSGVPMFADAQTAEWVLHLHLGQTIPYPTEQASEMKLRLIGLLSDSIFQNALLISEVNFRRYFPAHAGYSQFLIETAPDAPLEQIARQLESLLGNKYGFSVRPTLEVLAEYHQVENLYLQTFQMLGALGLVLGTSGLAVVLLRNIYERRTELALLQALGYTPRMLAWVVLIENGLLVILGLGTGTLAAAISISPYWYIVGAIQQSLAQISMLVGVLLLVGILAGSAAMASVLRLRALAILRQE